MNNKDTHLPLKRILAWTALVLIAADIICLFANILCGGDSKVTLLLLFFIIVIPAVVYIFLFFIKATSGRGSDAGPDADEG